MTLEPRPLKLQLQQSTFLTVTYYTLFSVILTLTACQTSNPTTENRSNQAGKDEVSTSLSVATSFLDAGRPDKAMQELNDVLRAHPTDTDALNLMGITQLALANPRRAVIHLEKAWKLQAASAIGVNLSSAYIELNRYKEAEKLLKTLIARKDKPLYEHRERLFHNYGLVLEKTNRLVAAEKQYRNATEENPTFHLSRLQLARIYQEQKKPQLAVKELDAARFACPQCFDPTAALVKIYADRGDITKARLMLRDYRRVEGIAAFDRTRALALEKEILGPQRQAAAESSKQYR